MGASAAQISRCDPGLYEGSVTVELIYSECLTLIVVPSGRISTSW